MIYPILSTVERAGCGRRNIRAWLAVTSARLKVGGPVRIAGGPEVDFPTALELSSACGVCTVPDDCSQPGRPHPHLTCTPAPRFGTPARRDQRLVAAGWAGAEALASGPRSALTTSTGLQA